jgi:transcriptional regulator with XRE-family HTH domain
MREDTDCVALHERQHFGPRIRDAPLAPVADYVGLKVEHFSEPTDSASSVDRLVKNVHSGQSITKVSSAPISFETSTYDDMKTIAERLVFARKSKGPAWTQRHLAVAAGVSTGTIGNMELGLRGATGSIPGTLPQIAKALGVRFDWLAYGTGDIGASAQQELPAIGPSPDALRVARWIDKIADQETKERIAHLCIGLVLREIDGPPRPPTPEPEPAIEKPRVSGRAR